MAYREGGFESQAFLVLQCSTTSKLLGDLDNRVDQLQSCQKVNIKESSLAKFDDLIDLLSYKIIRDMEPKVESIRDIV